MVFHVENFLYRLKLITYTNGVALGFAKRTDGLRIKIELRKVWKCAVKIELARMNDDDNQRAANRLNRHERIDLHRAIRYRSSSGGITFSAFVE